MLCPAGLGIKDPSGADLLPVVFCQGCQLVPHSCARPEDLSHDRPGDNSHHASQFLMRPSLSFAKKEGVSKGGTYCKERRAFAARSLAMHWCSGSGRPSSIFSASQFWSCVAASIRRTVSASLRLRIFIKASFMAMRTTHEDSRERPSNR